MGHESTLAYIATAQTQQAATHQQVRDLLRSANTVAAAFQTAVAAQRGAFMSMQLDETDPRIAGKFVELFDQLKTADRISGEMTQKMTELPPLLARMEQMIVDLNALTQSVLAETATT